jgi:hypothetical protein
MQDVCILWCSELSSGIYCRVKLLSTDVSEVLPDDGGSTHLWNVGRQSFYTAVYPRRQLWTSYSPPWELEISQGGLVSRLVTEPGISHLLSRWCCVQSERVAGSSWPLREMMCSECFLPGSLWLWRRSDRQATVEGRFLCARSGLRTTRG